MLEVSGGIVIYQDMILFWIMLLQEILMTVSAWSSILSDVKYPSEFFPTLNKTHASSIPSGDCNHP